jgi:hypothetical protein
MINQNVPRGRVRAVLGTIVAAALSVTLFAPPAHAAQAGSAGAAAPVVSWSACRDGFQCATVPAPLDYDRPAGV